MTLTESAPRLAPALDARYYRDPEVAELEQTRIFARSWQLVAHISQLPNPGDYLTGTAGVQPVLVLRADDGKLRAFRNVCRHRGSRLLSGSGQCGKAIRCLYHGWTYRLDGQLIGVPEGRSIADLDKSELGLFPARVETLCGLVFVNLDIHAQPLAEQVAGLPERLAPYDIEGLKPSGEWHNTQPANWKIVLDNYNEGYHVPIAHPGLMRLLDYKRYDVEVHDGWVWFEAPMRDKPSGNRDGARLPAPRDADARSRRERPARVALRDDLPEHHDRPLSRPGRDLAHRSRRAAPRRATRPSRYRHPRAGLRTRLARLANNRLNTLVGKEDYDLVENVQAGLETRGFELGPLSHREAAIAWFADRIRADLG